jgi:hypothetical protein
VYDRTGHGAYVKWWIETMDGMKLLGGLAFNMPKARSAARRNLRRAMALYEQKMFEYVLNHLPDVDGDEPEAPRPTEMDNQIAKANHAQS